MVGERRKKRPAANRGSRPGSRKGARGGGSRSTPTGSRERRKKSSKAMVVQFPQGRQPKHSKTLGRRKSGSGRFRLIVAAVVVVCVLLSLEGRAVQLSVAKDDRYQALTTEAYANERHDSATPGETVGRGPIVSADGRYLAVSLDTAKVIAT